MWLATLCLLSCILGQGIAYWPSVVNIETYPFPEDDTKEDMRDYLFLVQNCLLQDNFNATYCSDSFEKLDKRSHFTLPDTCNVKTTFLVNYNRHKYGMFKFESRLPLPTMASATSGRVIKVLVLAEAGRPWKRHWANLAMVTYSNVVRLTDLNAKFRTRFSRIWSVTLDRHEVDLDLTFAGFLFAAPESVQLTLLMDYVPTFTWCGQISLKDPDLPVPSFQAIRTLPVMCFPMWRYLNGQDFHHQDGCHQESNWWNPTHIIPRLNPGTESHNITLNTCVCHVKYNDLQELDAAHRIKILTISNFFGFYKPLYVLVTYFGSSDVNVEGPAPPLQYCVVFIHRGNYGFFRTRQRGDPDCPCHFSLGRDELVLVGHYVDVKRIVGITIFFDGQEHRISYLGKLSRAAVVGDDTTNKIFFPGQQS
uniref:Protein M1 n=1 Tax=Wood mouse herpesvirus TaxID=432370 RepID=D0PP93_9GAMA|nr:protein M1 [Wood mouse herpesvirus]